MRYGIAQVLRLLEFPTITLRLSVLLTRWFRVEPPWVCAIASGFGRLPSKRQSARILDHWNGDNTLMVHRTLLPGSRL